MVKIKVIKNVILNVIKKVLVSLGLNNLPDFLIIGAQKSGTVALSFYLNQHPKILGVKNEIYFFNTNNYLRGINWYKKKLPLRLKSNKLIFEKTPGYCYYPESAERIYNFKKNIKLILVIRNPIKRAFSGWNHYKKYYHSENNFSKEKLINDYNNLLGKEKAKDMVDFLSASEYKNFNDCINEEIDIIRKNIFRYDPSFVRRGLYFEQIQHYLNYFDKKQLLIIESSELKNKKEEVLNQVTEFLGIPYFDFSKIDLKDAHRSDYKKDKIDDNSYKILKDFYKPYNEKLFDLIGTKYNWD